jgi:hypothetical protein
MGCKDSERFCIVAFRGDIGGVAECTLLWVMMRFKEGLLLLARRPTFRSWSKRSTCRKQDQERWKTIQLTDIAWTMKFDQKIEDNCSSEPPRTADPNLSQSRILRTKSCVSGNENHLRNKLSNFSLLHVYMPTEYGFDSASLAMLNLFLLSYRQPHALWNSRTESITNRRCRK